jgi:hypothetical protein
MHPYARTTAKEAAGNDDIDVGCDPGETPKLSRTAVTQQGSGAAAQNRRHQTPLPIHFRPAQGIDTAPEGMQTTAGDPVFDRVRAKAKLQQL